MQFNINDSILGKTVATSDRYDASLLFRIPRSENRVHYGLKNANLPFTGVDVWNCYEVSFLTDNGLPVSRMMKMIYSAENEFLVESKSLKLYLNSFNMEKFGATINEAVCKVSEIIANDLTQLLETSVQAVLFGIESAEQAPFSELTNCQIIDLINAEKLESLTFSNYLETPDLLQATPTAELQEYAFRTDLLRSNCRVTNQPDWGDLFVKMTAAQCIDLSSVVAYLVSFRRENHFHEEVVEMIYKRFWDIFKPEKLVVAAMYTRRGGIDINPIRASHPELLDEAFVSTQCRLAKTLRQ